MADLARWKAAYTLSASQFPSEPGDAVCYRQIEPIAAEAGTKVIVYFDGSDELFCLTVKTRHVNKTQFEEREGWHEHAAMVMWLKRSAPT